MIIAKTISVVGFLFTLVMIIYAIVAGDFSAEGDWLLNHPWGLVSLADLYTGFVLFAGWIVFRERSWWKSLLWIAVLMTMGFITACLYIFIAAKRSDNDWQKFWMGKAYNHA